MRKVLVKVMQQLIVGKEVKILCFEERSNKRGDKVVIWSFSTSCMGFCYVLDFNRVKWYMVDIYKQTKVK